MDIERTLALSVERESVEVRPAACCQFGAIVSQEPFRSTLFCFVRCSACPCRFGSLTCCQYCPTTLEPDRESNDVRMASALVIGKMHRVAVAF